MRTIFFIFMTFVFAHGLEEIMPASKTGYIHYRYHNGFEKEDDASFKKWAKNGDVTVNFMGVTDEKQAEGKKSFKIDITFNTATYYYVSIPLNIACEGDVTVKSSIYIEGSSTASAVTALNFQFPPTRDSGVSRQLGSEKKDAWVQVRNDTVAADAMKLSYGFFRKMNNPGLTPETGGKIIDLFGVTMNGSAGKRVVVYIDDIEIYGTVPEFAAYKSVFETRIAKGKVETRRIASGWRDDLNAFINRLTPLTPDSGYGKTYAERILGQVRFLTESLDKMIQSDAIAMERAPEFQFYGIAADDIAANCEFLSKSSPKGMVVHVVDPASPFHTLPDTPVIKGRIRDEITMSMCTNEYESASLVVTALEDLPELMVSATPLQGVMGTIPASAIDIKVVKCWYQTEWDVFSPITARLKSVALYPELLLNDDTLVKVDHLGSNNYLRLNGTYQSVTGKKYGSLGRVTPSVADFPVEDSASLKPVAVEKGKHQQFHLRLQLPGGTLPGSYRGTITLKSGPVTKSLSMTLTVLDFALRHHGMISSIYYVSKLDPSGKGTVSSEWKSDVQFLAEMKNLVAHGIDNPTVYQKIDDLPLLDRTMKLRAEAGIDNGTVYWLGYTTGGAGDEKAEKLLFDKVAQAKKIFAEYGTKTLYLYGIDEAVGERMLKQLGAWEKINAMGVKVFTAGYPGSMKPVAHALNVFVCAAGLGLGIDRDEIALFHKHGNKVLSYSDPMVGVEYSYAYRKNFGLLLSAQGLDGAMDYAYQHSFGNIWDDTDDFTYKDHVFAYPTVTGVIDTLQYEGYREGMDDLRYLATLDDAISHAESKKNDGIKIENARRIRAKVIGAVLKAGSGDTYLVGRGGDRSFVDLPALRASLIEAIQSLNAIR